MSWVLRYEQTAEKELSKLDKGIQRSIKEYLSEVCQLEDPAFRGHPLTGPWAGYHRYRVGQIRMIVDIDRSVITVTVIKIDRRDSVY